MPEAPELQVATEVLQRALPGQSVLEAHVLRPTVLRSLVERAFAQDIAGREFEGVQRRGKSLTFNLSDDRLLAVFPMLTGALQYCGLGDRLLRATCFVLSLSSGMELRYLDDRQMGMVYYLSQAQVSEVRRMDEGGPDVLDEPLGHQEFVTGLKKYRGEYCQRGHSYALRGLDGADGKQLWVVESTGTQPEAPNNLAPEWGLIS